MPASLPALAPRQRDAFYDQGFAICPGVFGAAEVAAMRAAFDRLLHRARRLRRTCLWRGARFVVQPTLAAPGGLRVQRIVWCGHAEPALGAWGRDPRLLGLAAPLLRSAAMDQIICQAHFKLPGDGVRFPWHQDSSHRRYGGRLWRDVNGRGSYVQTIVALDDVRADNGPLRFLPGTHRFGHLDLPADGRLPRHLVDPVTAVAPEMEAGDVLLFGPYVIHGSSPNTSSRPRRAFINGFAAPGANRRVYPGAGKGRRVALEGLAAPGPA